MSQELNYAPTRSAIYHPLPAQLETKPFILGLVFGVVIEIAAAWFYIWWYHEYNQFIPRILGCIGFASGTGVMAVLFCESVELRSKKLAMIIGTAFGFLGLVVSWLFWLKREIFTITGVEIGVWRLLIRPIADIRFVWFLHDAGVWSYRGYTIHGLPLLIVWFIEAALIVGIPMLIATAITERVPRCTTCRTKLARSGKQLNLSGRDSQAVTAALHDRQFEVMREHVETDEERDNYRSPRTIVRIYSCSKCPDVHTLHAIRAEYVATRKGKFKRVETMLIPYLFIGAEQATQVNAIVDSLVAD